MVIIRRQSGRSGESEITFLYLASCPCAVTAVHGLDHKVHGGFTSYKKVYAFIAASSSSTAASSPVATAPASLSPTTTAAALPSVFPPLGGLTGDKSSPKTR